MFAMANWTNSCQLNKSIFAMENILPFLPWQIFICLIMAIFLVLFITKPCISCHGYILWSEQKCHSTCSRFCRVFYNMFSSTIVVFFYYLGLLELVLVGPVEKGRMEETFGVESFSAEDCSSFWLMGRYELFVRSGELPERTFGSYWCPISIG